MEIKDSGERREFDSGAVRDIAEGKGRCDLLPLDVVGTYLNDNGNIDMVLTSISNFVHSGDTNFIFLAMNNFRAKRGWDAYTAMLEVSKHYEDGAKKYDERNWEKGISLHCYIDSGVRHYIKYRRGDTDEPHDRAFLWNMLGAVWTQRHRPECVDLPYAEEKQR